MNTWNCCEGPWTVTDYQQQQKQIYWATNSVFLNKKRLYYSDFLYKLKFMRNLRTDPSNLNPCQNVNKTFQKFEKAVGVSQFILYNVLCI